METRRSCADCRVKACDAQGKPYPPFCLTTVQKDDEALRQAMALYEDAKNGEIMRNAAAVEYEFYCKMTRLEETIEFARRMGYRKIGIATCVGLLRETGILTDILRSHGFEVFGVACKAGAVDKTAVGIDEKCREVGANICNPIHQALRLNREKTDMNIVMGLCVGHDSLFYKYAEAPTTTLVTKDRVLGHNPAAALYNASSYYKRVYGREEE